MQKNYDDLTKAYEKCIGCEVPFYRSDGVVLPSFLLLFFVGYVTGQVIH